MSRLLLVLLASSALAVSACRAPATTSSDSTTPAATTRNAAPADPGAPVAVKSQDGTFEGEVWGRPAKGSKFIGLQIGMQEADIVKKIGQGTGTRAYTTGKAWIPFYHGTDAHRFETHYKGHGSLIYTGGIYGGGRGVLVGINHDAKDPGH
ncbi:hypothetical protein AGMMS49543_05630 [Betaproteobacteria bacterium]|nr:hypothetical protein AGMMS49543_05630 [Betaproteobacteria bacterium]GHU07344.1 hypothetical protein AGMMS50225_04130 [Betaproteobacteria bacterium]